MRGGRSIQGTCEAIQKVAKSGVIFHFFLDGSGRVNDGAVITTSEGSSDVLKRTLSMAASQEHSDLSRMCYISRAATTIDISHANVEFLGHAFLYVGYGDISTCFLFLEEIIELHAGILDGRALLRE